MIIDIKDREMKTELHEYLNMLEIKYKLDRNIWADKWLENEIKLDLEKAGIANVTYWHGVDNLGYELLKTVKETLIDLEAGLQGNTYSMLIDNGGTMVEYDNYYECLKDYWLTDKATILENGVSVVTNF